MELVYLHIILFIYLSIYLFTYVFTAQNRVSNKRMIVRKRIGKKCNDNDPALISETSVTFAWSH
jgi:hypothetical protein